MLQNNYKLKFAEICQIIVKQKTIGRVIISKQIFYLIKTNTDTDDY